jgi:hypothetical protein
MLPWQSATFAARTPHSMFTVLLFAYRATNKQNETKKPGLVWYKPNLPVSTCVISNRGETDSNWCAPSQ